MKTSVKYFGLAARP